MAENCCGACCGYPAFVAVKKCDLLSNNAAGGASAFVATPADTHTHTHEHDPIDTALMDAACTATYAIMRRLLIAARNLSQRHDAHINVSFPLRFMWNNTWGISCTVKTFSDGCVYVFSEPSIWYPHHDWFAATRASHVAWKWFNSPTQAKPVVCMGVHGAIEIMEPIASRSVFWPVDGGVPPRSFELLPSNGEEASFVTRTSAKPFVATIVIGCPFADSVARLFALAGIAITSVHAVEVYRDDETLLKAVDIAIQFYPDERVAAAVHELQTL